MLILAITLASVLLGLAAPAMAVGPYPDYTPARTTGLTGCPQVAVVGFRGSGQAFDDGSLGLGNDVKAFYDQLAQRIGASALGSSATSYPAIPFLVSMDQWGSRLDLAAGSAANLVKMLLPGGYTDSVATGGLDGASDITHLAVRCANTKIVVSGFSQGAHAARVALAKLNATTAARVTAVVLMGDSSFSATEAGVTVTAGSGPGAGIAYGLGKPIDGLSRFAGRVLSACHPTDPICRGLDFQGLSGHYYVPDAPVLANWTQGKLFPSAPVPALPAPAPVPGPVSSTCVGFVSDVTVPDGTVVPAGGTFQKTWRLRNCGTAHWAGLTAVRTSGGFGPTSFAAAQASPGAVVDVGTAMSAPASPGTYRSTYRMRTSNGQFTGDSFWAQIVVPAPTAPCEQLVADVTVPDGTVVQPGADLTKTWRLRNCGSAAWSGVTAARTFGNYGPGSFAVPDTAPGATADVSITLTAPTTPGVQRATFRLQDSAGRTAANSFWVEVSVPQPSGSGRQGVTSYDRMTGGAPYHGYFDYAFQPFTAASAKITTLGVTVGNPALAAGTATGSSITVQLCTDPGCAHVIGQAAAPIVNYGKSVADIGDVPVTKGATYYIGWRQPAAAGGSTWVTYWWSGGSSIGQSDQMQALVQGYDSLAVVLGDLTGDGYVGCADQAVLIKNFNLTPAGPADGDLNSDGIVNIQDLSILLSHWAAAPGDSC